MDEEKHLIKMPLRMTNSERKGSEFARTKIAVLLSTFTVACLIMYVSSFEQFDLPRSRFSSLYTFISGPLPLGEADWVRDDYELRKLLETTSTADKTVILTTLNEAWAEPNSIFDYFLRSLKTGNNTAPLLKHVLVICYDTKAYARCRSSPTHCYLFRSRLSTELAREARFMSPIYMSMMWERLAFLQNVLSIGYNFVFTDTDVMWLRDPFSRFFPDVDIQTSCDRFNGRPFDLNNHPNNGFTFVRSNNRTIEFYKYWVASRLRYPQLHEQDAFNKIKHEPFIKQIGLKIRFLDTDYFGGFCRPSKDFNKVCTMHANCCVGLDRKLSDLNTTLQDWNKFMKKRRAKWRVPRKCRRSWPKFRSLASLHSDFDKPNLDHR